MSFMREVKMIVKIKTSKNMGRDGVETIYDVFVDGKWRAAFRTDNEVRNFLRGLYGGDK